MQQARPPSQPPPRRPHHNHNQSRGHPHLLPRSHPYSHLHLCPAFTPTFARRRARRRPAPQLTRRRRPAAHRWCRCPRTSVPTCHASPRCSGRPAAYRPRTVTPRSAAGAARLSPLLLLRRRRRVHGAHCGVELPQRVVPCAALLLASARLLCLLEGLARAAAPAAHRDRLDEHLVHVDHGLRAQNMHMHTRSEKGQNGHILQSKVGCACGEGCDARLRRAAISWAMLRRSQAT